VSEGLLACPNVDLSVAVHRPCASEWIGLRVDSIWTADGRGTAGGLLVDELGAFGRVAIAFLVVT
jgi:hypothetical protein